MGVIWLFQERLVFLPPPVPAQQGRGAERVEFTAADGAQAFGFYVDATRADSAPASSSAGGAPHRVVIVFHGNADLAHYWIDWAREVEARFGWSVLLAEYRGYGGAPGKPTYKALMHDARAALGYVHEQRGVPLDDILLYGHSVGTGVATELATEFNPRAVVLEAPLTSIVAMGKRSFVPPFSWLLPLISRIHFAPADRVARIDAPVWVAIGERDNVIPPAMGRTVMQSARHKGELLVVPNAGHGDISDRGGEAYWAWLGSAGR